MKVIIAGPRDITNKKACSVLVEHAISIGATEIVCGGCRGVDNTAAAIADGLLPVKFFPVSREEWNKLGPSAGPKRNAKMAQYGDYLIVLTNGHTPGTASMIREMKRAGKGDRIKEFKYSEIK